MDKGDSRKKTLVDYTAELIKTEDILKSEELLKAAFTQAIEEKLSSGQIVKRIDLSEWLAHQFRTATNNEGLQAQMISGSGFFKHFDEFSDTGKLTVFCTKNARSLNNAPYVANGNLHLFFDMNKLGSKAASAHESINRQIADGEKITVGNIDGAIENTIVQAFQKAHTLYFGNIR